MPSCAERGTRCSLRDSREGSDGWERLVGEFISADEREGDEAFSTIKQPRAPLHTSGSDEGRLHLRHPMAGARAVARATGGVSKRRRFGLRAQHTQAPRPAAYLGSGSDTLRPGRGRWAQLNGGGGRRLK